MQRTVISLVLAAVLLLAGATLAVSPDTAQKLYDEVTPSLVAVEYTWDSELGRRELIGAGVVVGADGLVMTSLAIFDPRIPDEQMKDFKIILPRHDRDHDEFDAIFVGRDERTNVAFVRTEETQEWPALGFEDAPLQIGEPVMSVGLLPEAAGYRSYLASASVSAMLRGEVPMVMVDAGGLTFVGSPVFNLEGKAIGFVNMQPNAALFLNDASTAMAALNAPPRFFVPARDFELSLNDPPKAGEPMPLPWVGVVQLTGLRKDVAEFFGLENQPAVEVGDVIPDSPADQGGLRRGHVIVQINGEPLQRGDQIEELPQILARQLLRKTVGEELRLSVLSAPGEELEELTITLGERPKRPNLAARHFFEDLGFTARDIVFWDTYQRRIDRDHEGVIIDLIRPQSSAHSNGLEPQDLVIEMNGEPVADLEQFRESYEQFREQRPRDAVVLVVLRDGGTQVVRIEPPQ